MDLQAVTEQIVANLPLVGLVILAIRRDLSGLRGALGDLSQQVTDHAASPGHSALMDLVAELRDELAEVKRAIAEAGDG